MRGIEEREEGREKEERAREKNEEHLGSGSRE